MNPRRALAAGAVLLIAALWYARRAQAAAAINPNADPGPAVEFYALPAASVLDYALADVQDQLEGAAAVIMEEAGAVIRTFLPWSVPQRATPYLSAIREAEERYALPENLLVRLLEQESHYRPEIIDGRVASPAGAQGIAQFMPATAAEFRINPLDPWQSIDAAGKYLAQLYARFGNWPDALAAYNWGMGNVSRKGRGAAPLETRNYVAGILGDIGLGSTA